MTPELPYPLATGYVRYYQYLRMLSQHHEIDLVSLTRRTSISAETQKELARFTNKIIVYGLPQPGEAKVIEFASRIPHLGPNCERALRERMAAYEMRDGVREMLRHGNYDLVFFSGKSTYPVLDAVTDVPIIVDCCDADYVRLLGERQYSRGARRLWLTLRYLEMKRLEEKLVRRVSCVLFASERDSKALYRGGIGAWIVPQGVTIEHWRRTRLSLPKRIVFTGVMRYPPNHSAAMRLAQEVMPRIRRVIPDTTCYIVGRDPKPELRNVAKSCPGVTVTGEVADIRPYLNDARVFVAPLLYASGIQNKILEAMAAEVPVVTTPIVVEGLKRRGITSIPIAVGTHPDALAAAAIRLLENDHDHDELTCSAYRFVERYFSLPLILQQLQEICDQVAKLPEEPLAAVR